MRTSLVILLVLLICPFSFSQKGWGVGACGIYNAGDDIGGAGARVLIPVKKKYYAVPYIFYYFPTKEFSGGLAAMVPFYKYEVFNFYALASASLRAQVTVSVNDSVVSKSTSKEADGEFGVGVLIGDGCLKGLFEPRYAVVNKEITIRAGFVYFIGCKSKGRNKGPAKNRWREGDYSNARQRTFCPAYN